MPEDVKQPVVTETKTPPVANVAGNDAPDTGDDLDNLLKQFDQETPKPPPPKPEPVATDPTLKALADRVEGKLGELNAITYRNDMDKTIKEVRGELDSNLFDDELVESWLDGQARKDPRLAQAWANRNANPQAFEKVKTQLGKSFAQKFAKMPDTAATEDRAAVAAAVRGASTRAPEGKPPEYAKMSDSDFQKEKDKLFGA